jgi:hypothetical protein
MSKIDGYFILEPKCNHKDCPKWSECDFVSQNDVHPRTWEPEIEYSPYYQDFICPGEKSKQYGGKH